MCLTHPRPVCSEDEYKTTEPAIKIIGIVDVRDLLACFVAQIDPSHFEGDVRVDELLAEVEAAGRMVCNSPISEVVPSLKRREDGSGANGGDGALLASGKWKETDSLVHLLEAGFFEKMQVARRLSLDADACARAALAPVRLVHRVAMFDADGRIALLVSQSDVIRALAEHADKIEDVKGQTLLQLGLGAPADSEHPSGSYLVCVPSQRPTVRVLQQLVSQKLSGLGVTDEATGELVGMLSASDFRGIESDKFAALALPIIDFIRARPRDMPFINAQTLCPEY